LKRCFLARELPYIWAGSKKSDARCRREGRETVAKVIEIYTPTNCRKSMKWVPLELRGKIIEFASQVKKSA
jgi:hypothetical protein